MEDTLHWDLEESREAISSINVLDMGLTNLETLLKHGFTLWVEGGKLKYKAPEELDSSWQITLLKMAKQFKPEIVSVISDPESVRKRLADAQWALSEMFNHASVLEEDLDRLSEILKGKNNGKR
tara:strand:+ start:204 stop:575 length:372 start_codon:yes stop_codon:yes gene_type:complete